MGNSMLHSVSGFIHLMNLLKFKGKKAAAFGCYGWSGGSVKAINEAVAAAGFELIADGLPCQWNPTEGLQKQAVDFGKAIAKA